MTSSIETKLKSVTSSSSGSVSQTSPSWSVSLSQYIRTSDEALMKAAPKLLAYFEENLLTISSVEEFLDVTGKLFVIIILFIKSELKI